MSAAFSRTFGAHPVQQHRHLILGFLGSTSCKFQIERNALRCAKLEGPTQRFNEVRPIGLTIRCHWPTAVDLKAPKQFLSLHFIRQSCEVRGPLILTAGPAELVDRQHLQPLQQYHLV